MKILRSGNGIEKENNMIRIDKLKETLKSVCSIKVTCNNNKEMCGTGFLVKLIIPLKENALYGLMTTNHVLTSEYLKFNKSIKIVVNNKTFEINLNNNNFVFTSELIDITFIQLTDEKFFNNSDIYFLNPDIDKNKTYEKKQISIPQYTYAQKLFVSFGMINSLSGFNYIHTASTEYGSLGSPLLNNDLNIIGVYKCKFKKKNGFINVATNFSVIEDVIRVMYNKRYIYDINKAREKPRVLNDDELEELRNHGLETTKIYNVFRCQYLKSNKSVLFYKSNHGWYCTKQMKSKYDEENLEILKWTFINPYEPIKTIIKKIGKGKLEHRHEVIIMWLKLSEFMYII